MQELRTLENLPAYSLNIVTTKDMTLNRYNNNLPCKDYKIY